MTSEPVAVRILGPRHNNWHINRDMLDRVREGLRHRVQRPPVLVPSIGVESALIDGHSRAFAAFERGETGIVGHRGEPLEPVEGSRALDEHIHRKGPGIGVRSVADLAGCVVEPEEHRRLWIGYCEEWFKRNTGRRWQG